jgi:hypothetical protein
MVIELYRIENIFDGKGMFSSEPVNLFIGYDYDNDDIHSCFSRLLEKHTNFPTPYREEKLNYTVLDDEFCAFQSYEDLKVWVDRDAALFLLNEYDFIVKKIYIEKSNCRIGDYQTLFKKEHVIAFEDITKYFLNDC